MLGEDFKEQSQDSMKKNAKQALVGRIQPGYRSTMVRTELQLMLRATRFIA
jgi:hypothetical protein